MSFSGTVNSIAIPSKSKLKLRRVLKKPRMYRPEADESNSSSSGSSDDSGSDDDDVTKSTSASCSSQQASKQTLDLPAHTTLPPGSSSFTQSSLSSSHPLGASSLPTPPVASPPSTHTDKSSSINIGAIIGGTVAGLVVILLGLIFRWSSYRRYKRRDQRTNVAIDPNIVLPKLTYAPSGMTPTSGPVRRNADV